MTTWIIQNLTMLILNVALNFTFVCNLKLLQVWQSEQSPIHAFTSHIYICVWAKGKALHLNIEILFWGDFKNKIKKLTQSK